MSGWWLLAPVVLVAGACVVAATGRRLQREAAGLRYAASSLAPLADDVAELRREAAELADHLDRTRAVALGPDGDDQ